MINHCARLKVYLNLLSLIVQRGNCSPVDAMYALLTKREVKMAGYWPVLRDKSRIPNGQGSSILPARVANHSARFGYIII